MNSEPRRTVRVGLALGILGASGGVGFVVWGIIVSVGASGIGFEKKTLWDWLNLLVIPLILTVGGTVWSFKQRQNDQRIADERQQNDREIAEDGQREDALQSYLDRMAELLLAHSLSESSPTSHVRAIASARTLTVLRRLDRVRKGVVVRFLYEAHLIHRMDDPNVHDQKPVVSLAGADLSGVVLSAEDLSGGVDLSGANMIDASLRGAVLDHALMRGVNLERADLFKASLWHAVLENANLRMTNLGEADLRKANLDGVDLRWTNLDGSRGLDLKKYDYMMCPGQLDRLATAEVESDHELDNKDKSDLEDELEVAADDHDEIEAAADEQQDTPSRQP